MSDEPFTDVIFYVKHCICDFTAISPFWHKKPLVSLDILNN